MLLPSQLWKYASGVCHRNDHAADGAAVPDHRLQGSYQLHEGE